MRSTPGNNEVQPIFGVWRVKTKDTSHNRDQNMGGVYIVVFPLFMETNVWGIEFSVSEFAR